MKLTQFTIFHEFTLLGGILELSVPLPWVHLLRRVPPGPESPASLLLIIMNSFSWPDETLGAFTLSLSLTFSTWQGWKSPTNSLFMSPSFTCQLTQLFLSFTFLVSKLSQFLPFFFFLVPLLFILGVHL